MFTVLLNLQRVKAERINTVLVCTVAYTWVKKPFYLPSAVFIAQVQVG